MATVGAETGGIGQFHIINAPDTEIDRYAAIARDTRDVLAVYIKPAAEPATLSDTALPTTSQNFEFMQGYLNAPPEGIRARDSWNLPGGKGSGVHVIDVEGEWRHSHISLIDTGGNTRIPLTIGVSLNDIGWRNHGTAVTGVIGASQNGFGVTGIAPETKMETASIFTSPTSASSSQAIVQAALRLNAGDILLIELHRPGPRYNYATRNDQKGYVAIEWWPDDFAAIRFATDRGIIVVEAAGNGAEDLDDSIYSQRPVGFPSTWVNPYARQAVDSGAIIVGAGAPPSGSYGADRSRLDFSNYGGMIDAQGWGREVTTCGYGDLQGGPNEDMWYTAQFSGTSSASPIVVGALACAQGIRRATGKTLLTPLSARNLLRTSGSPQTASKNAPATERIGNRPDIQGLI